MKKIFLFLFAFLCIAGSGNCLEPAEPFPEDVITDSECEAYEAATDKKAWLQEFRQFKAEQEADEKELEITEL